MAIYLFIFYVVFLLVLFAIPSYIKYKRTGVSRLKSNTEDTTINYVGNIYKMVSTIAFITIILNAFVPGIRPYFAPIIYLEKTYLVYIGLGFIHLAFLFIFIAQRNMANEWRVDIAGDEKINLVTHGLFSISRNPIFFSVIMLYVGLFLIIPNLVTAIILVTAVIVIQIQVRLEEEFLLSSLGDEYKKYMEKVNRWLF